MHRSIPLVVAALVLACCVAPAPRPALAGDPDPAAAPAAAADLAMQDEILRFREDSESLDRALSVPFSADEFDRTDAFLADWEARLDAEAPAGGARASSSDVDWALLRDEVRHRRTRIPFDRARFAECLELAPFAADLAALEMGRRSRRHVTPEEAAKRLDAAKRALDAVRGRVEKGLSKKDDADALKPSRTVANRTAARLDHLRGVLQRWFDGRNGFEPDFSWWAEKPWGALRGALEGYAKFLREKVAEVYVDDGGSILGDPIGREALAAELAHEFIPYSPEEVLAIADREMDWCRTQARAAAQEMGLGDDWKAALARVKDLHVAPGEQDELVAAQAQEAIEFVTSRDLVTVPDLCRELWSLQMIPERTQRTMPYAYYSGDSMGVAYPSSEMDQERKLQSMRGNNVHFSRLVTPHELIPGHHLQMFQAARNRPYRGLFSTPFLVEGWALYWEMRLWDLGWAKSPEDRIGMLFWRMHRCARITVSLKFHLGDMTPDQMIEYLVNEVGHEKDGATAEVRRYVGGGYGPLYQAAYMLGGLQLRSLHDELVGDGKPMTERAFHDAVLRQGPIPVRMIRAALVDEPFDPRSPAPWKF